MTEPRILVAGIGNVFFGDDGFGVAVLERLARRAWPGNVVLMDVGIRGLDLTYALMDDFDAAILVDATARGGAPGTLYVLEPEAPSQPPDETLLLDAHGMDPARVLAYLRAVGAKLGTLRVVGCEPSSLGSDDEPAVGLSPVVEAAIEPACVLVESVLAALSADVARARGAETGGPDA